MNNPYIDTILYTSIDLKPNQISNDIYKNLKDNLKKKLEKKCYRDYGFIMNIYEMKKYENGIIRKGDLSASAKFNITFSCKLCTPLKGKEIICQVKGVNKMLLTAENGPILVIIPKNRINDKKFFTDNNNNLRYRTDQESKIVKSREFIKISIIAKTFNDGDDKIKVIGFLNSMASNNEIKQYYDQIYTAENKTKKYREYIDANSKEQ